MISDKVFIIAEAGVNHNGDRKLAFDLVEAAAASGADAVKFQTFNAKRLAADSAPKAAYQQQATEAGESQLAMLQALELPLEWHEPLQRHAHQRGIEFLSTAFDLQSLAFLETLGLPFYKVPSGEITNAPLLWAFAHTRKPLVVSTGMASLSEIEQALAIISHAIRSDQPPQGMGEVWRNWSEQAAREVLSDRVSLLHCTSQYPTPMAEVNLKAMDTLSSVFGLPVGYSDHTQDLLIPIAATARDATIIEKHFTLDRQLPGPDHKASLEPDELTHMVDAIRQVSLALGDGYKAPQPSEWQTRDAVRQQLVARRSIKYGETFTLDNMTTARAGRGEPAYLYWDYLGKQAIRDYREGEML